MKSATVFLLIATTFLFMSCIESEKRGEFLFTNPVGIQLNPEKTTVILSDYFREYQNLRIIKCPGGLECVLADGDSILIEMTGEMAPLDVLQLEIGGLRADLLLKRSDKILVNFDLADVNQSFSKVSVVGDINSWNPDAGKLEFQNGKWSNSFWINPGRYGYQFEIDGERILDPENDLTLDNNIGGFNSLLLIESTSPDELPRILTKKDESSTFSLTVEGEYIGIVALLGSRAVDLQADDAGKYKIQNLPEKTGLNNGFMHVQAYSDKGAGPDLLIPVRDGSWVEDVASLSAEDWHRTSMYFLMVDRFKNGNPNNDQPVEDERILPIANHYGGDLEGVNQALTLGYFRELGVNSIWLSPIIQNPEGAYGFWDKGGVQSMFSGYHGYWPVSFTQIDHRFGTDEDLEKMVSLANQNNMTILLDLVANHVHEEHPFYRANKERENYFTNLYLPDGSLNTERWDDHRLTTWFDTFMPTMELRNPEVAELVSDSAVYWLERFGVHGFRHDATKHVPLSFWRMLTAKINQLSEETGRTYIQIGETYGSPELINSYINPGMLNSQFDFNVYDAVINSVIRPEIPLDRLAERLLESQKYYGTNHLMGNMSGNQDKPRIMSLATGEVAFDEDSKLAGWTRDINKTTPQGYSMVGLIHAINFFIPGIPVVYYGDEIGMPGGNDPDNRRMMQFHNLDSLQTKLKNTVSALASLRTNRNELVFGDFQILMVDPSAMIASRNYFSDQSWLLLNTSEESRDFAFDLKSSTVETDLFNNTPHHRNNSRIELTLPPESFEIFSTKSQ